VNPLGIRDGPEQTRHLGIAFLIGLVGENGVLHVRLALARESRFQVIFGHCSHWFASLQWDLLY